VPDHYRALNNFTIILQGLVNLTLDEIALLLISAELHRVISAPLFCCCLKLAECYLIKGQIDKALQNYGKIIQPPYNGQALLGTPGVIYFLKQWDQCQQTIQTILQSQGVTSLVNNDALALQIQLDIAQEVPEILGKLSEGELLIVQRRNRIPEKFKDINEMKSVPAASSWKSISASAGCPGTGGTVSGLNIGNQAVRIRSFQPMLTSTCTCWPNPGKICKPSQEAFSAYKQLLETYPNSLLQMRPESGMKYLREQPNFQIP